MRKIIVQSTLCPLSYSSSNSHLSYFVPIAQMGNYGPFMESLLAQEFWACSLRNFENWSPQIIGAIVTHLWSKMTILKMAVLSCPLLSLRAPSHFMLLWWEVKGSYYGKSWYYKVSLCQKGCCCLTPDLKEAVGAPPSQEAIPWPNNIRQALSILQSSLFREDHWEDGWHTGTKGPG